MAGQRDWNKVGQGCQQLGCALALLPVCVFILLYFPATHPCGEQT